MLADMSFKRPYPCTQRLRCYDTRAFLHRRLASRSVRTWRLLANEVAAPVVSLAFIARGWLVSVDADGNAVVWARQCDVYSTAVHGTDAPPFVRVAVVEVPVSKPTWCVLLGAPMLARSKTDAMVPCVQGPSPCSVNVANTFVESVPELCGTLVLCGLAVISNPYREHPTSSIHGSLGYWWQWGAHWRSGWRQCRTLWGKVVAAVSQGGNLAWMPRAINVLPRPAPLLLGPRAPPTMGGLRR